MKICQINCIYGIGSTGKIVRDIHQTLMGSGYQSIVIVPENNLFKSDVGVYTVSNWLLTYMSAILKRILGMQFDWAYLQTWRIIRILKKEKPDVVHLQCINGNNINIYMLLRYLAKNKIKTLYTLHAEFSYTGGCGNTQDCERWKSGCGRCPHLGFTGSIFVDGTHRTWKKQNKCYCLFDHNYLHFTAVSPWLASRAEKSSMLKGHEICPVYNGVDTGVFYYKKTDGGWRNKLGININEKLLLYVTASFFPHEHNLKGGHFILELANRFSNSPYKIVVAANYGDGSKLPGNVIYIGRTKSQLDLAELYREADVTILTSSSETFGMPVAESLCCGTPVVGFRAGGPESIAIAEYSDFVEYADIDALTNTIHKWVIVQKRQEQISNQARRIYSKETMTDNYISQYKRFEICI